MSANGIPFFLFRTGSGAAPAVQGGVRSMFAFWAGGAANEGTAPPRRVVVGDVGGKRRYHSELKIERGFSRRYFDEMLAAERAMLAALKASEERNRAEQQDALECAALAAQEALEAALENTEREEDFAKLTRSLNAAVSAKNFATSLKRAADAVQAAQAIIRAVEDEDEEEAVMLLLLN